MTNNNLNNLYIFIKATPTTVVLSNKMFEFTDKIDINKNNIKEFSFKVGKSGLIKNNIRLLNLDIQKPYKQKNLLKLKILSDFVKNRFKKIDSDFIFLKLFILHNHDNYYGYDLSNNEIINIAFWVILGNIDNLKNVDFIYKNEKIIDFLISGTNLKKSSIINGEIINFGIDITKDTIFYKIYRKFNSKLTSDKFFLKITKLIEDNFSGFIKHSFMFNNDGVFIKEKLFIELNKPLEINLENLQNIFNIFSSFFGFRYNIKDISLLSGYIYILSIEKSGELTFYIRDML